MKRRTLRKSDKAILVQMYGNKCRNCGSDENIEWHHIVPLEIGGNDTYENMVPLCHACHKTVTFHELLLATKMREQHNCGGRKRTIPDNYEDILWKYIMCKIGKAECVRMLGLSKSNNITDNQWFKDFVKDNKIKRHRNNIDLRMGQGLSLKDGTPVGYIQFEGEQRQTLYWSGFMIRGDKDVKQISLEDYMAV